MTSGPPRRAKVIRFPGPALPTAADDLGFVEVYRCDRAEAVVVKSLLDGDGIRTLLSARIAHSVHPFSVGDQGAVMILVPANDAPRSRRLLAHVVRRSSSTS
jgi:hypothetical protein